MLHLAHIFGVTFHAINRACGDIDLPAASFLKLKGKGESRGI